MSQQNTRKDELPKVELFDTSLRDGLQQPNLEISVPNAVMLLERMAAFGFKYAEIGFAGANQFVGDLTRALFEAHDADADGAVLVDRGGFVTEGPGYNIFSVTAGEVATPDRGALEGVTRKSVIELCAELDIRCSVRPVLVQELLQADEIFVTTTAGGPMPVSRINGRMMGNDRPGPLSSRLMATFWKKREAGWHGTPIDYDAPP